MFSTVNEKLHFRKKPYPFWVQLLYTATTTYCWWPQPTHLLIVISPTIATNNWSPAIVATHYQPLVATILALCLTNCSLPKHYWLPDIDLQLNDCRPIFDQIGHQLPTTIGHQTESPPSLTTGHHLPVVTNHLPCHYHHHHLSLALLEICSATKSKILFSRSQQKTNHLPLKIFFVGIHFTLK